MVRKMHQLAYKPRQLENVLLTHLFPLDVFPVDIAPLRMRSESIRNNLETKKKLRTQGSLLVLAKNRILTVGFFVCARCLMHQEGILRAYNGRLTVLVVMLAKISPAI